MAVRRRNTTKKLLMMTMKRQLTYIKPEIEITHVETESGLLESTYIPIGGTQTGGWDAPEYNGDFDEDDFG